MYAVSRLRPQVGLPPESAQAEYIARLIAASLEDASPVLQ
jgi:hypothetical protein